MSIAGFVLHRGGATSMQIGLYFDAALPGGIPFWAVFGEGGCTGRAYESAFDRVGEVGPVGRRGVKVDWVGWARLAWFGFAAGSWVWQLGLLAGVGSRCWQLKLACGGRCIRCIQQHALHSVRSLHSMRSWDTHTETTKLKHGRVYVYAVGKHRS